MDFDLPYNFSESVNDLDAYMREYKASIGDDQRKHYQRLALVTACDMLRSINTGTLSHGLTYILSDDTRTQREQILRRDKDFWFFLWRIERAILEQAEINETARERILYLLSAARPRAIEIISYSDVKPKSITSPIAQLADDICTLSDSVVQEHTKEYEARERRRRDTKLVKSFGVAAVAINVAAGIATAGSLLTIPAISIAASAASSILGAAAQALYDNE